MLVVVMMVEFLLLLNWKIFFSVCCCLLWCWDLNIFLDFEGLWSMWWFWFLMNWRIVCWLYVIFVDKDWEIGCVRSIDGVVINCLWYSKWKSCEWIGDCVRFWKVWKKLLSFGCGSVRDCYLVIWCSGRFRWFGIWNEFGVGWYDWWNW